MGAIVPTVKGMSVSGGQYKTWGTALVSSGANYATGGQDVTARILRLGSLDHFQISGGGDGGNHLEWDEANSKVMAYYADYTAGASGVLIQRSANADLSSVVFSWEAYGTA